MAKIAVEEGAGICDKLPKKPSKTNHPYKYYPNPNFNISFVD
jgi:hypothetical protein